MGAIGYCYVVKHQPDLQAALQELREREFRAGRYSPAMEGIDFPVDANSPGPGAQHATIDEAREAADPYEGTRSILDVDRVSEELEYRAAAPLGEADLIRHYGTARPTRAMFDADRDQNFLDDIERGCAVFFVLYRDDKPDEIVFAGYSFD